MKYENSKHQNRGRQSKEMGKSLGRESTLHYILKRCFELGTELCSGRQEEDSRVSGGSGFQSRGPMTEKALLPSNDLTYGMEKTRVVFVGGLSPNGWGCVDILKCL